MHKHFRERFLIWHWSSCSLDRSFSRPQHGCADAVAHYSGRQHLQNNPAWQWYAYSRIGYHGTVDETSVKLVFCDTARVNRFTIDLPDNYMVASLSYAGFGRSAHRYDLHAIAIGQPGHLITVFMAPATSSRLRQPQRSEMIIRWLAFKKCGHYPFIERPGYFLRMVEKAL